jgi:hypothetical protein
MYVCSCYFDSPENYGVGPAEIVYESTGSSNIFGGRKITTEFITFSNDSTVSESDWPWFGIILNLADHE